MAVGVTGALRIHFALAAAWINAPTDGYVTDASGWICAGDVMVHKLIFLRKQNRYDAVMIRVLAHWASAWNQT